MEGAFKNIVHWVRSNLHIDLINCMVDSPVYITKNTIHVVNDMVKQEVTLDKIHFHNIYHKSITFIHALSPPPLLRHKHLGGF